MLPKRPRDDADTAPDRAQNPEAEPLTAGARYRQHLEQFPERGTDTALRRAARALIRAAQIRLSAPRRAN